MIHKSTRRAVLILVLCNTFFLSASFVSAQNFVSLSGLQGQNFAPFLTQAFNSQSFPQFINAVFKAAIAIGAMLAVLQYARAGFMYMGGDSWHTKDKAKQILRETTMGVLLLLSIWLILRQINPQILDLNILQHVK